MNKIKLKIGDSVKVIAGDFFGLIDKIFLIKPKEKLIYLRKVTRKQYNKSPETKKKSELKEVLVPIHLSNVIYWIDEKKTTTRISLKNKLRKTKKYNIEIKEVIRNNK